MFQIKTTMKGCKLLKEKMPSLTLEGMVATVNKAARYVAAVSLLRQERIEFDGKEIR